MNDQEFFDKTARHLFAQGRRAIRNTPGEPDNGGCMYRAPDGTMCAIGCHIPDAAYSPALEGRPAHVLPEISTTLAQVFEGVDRNFMGRLQSVHDAQSSWGSTTRMRFQLRSAAATCENHTGIPLDTSILNTLSFEGR